LIIACTTIKRIVARVADEVVISTKPGERVIRR
jgi:hypothetical protein